MSEVKVNKITPRTDCGTTQLGDSGDTVTVTGDLRSNSLKAADGGVIISQSGTNITLGASGDTISLASGASQTGFGRTGTVDWQTGSIKTANFTAANGEGYFVNTTGGAITVTLPASPSAGDIVAVADYAGTSATNNITINRNGSPFEGATENGGITTNRQTATFVYVDATQGWIVVNSNDASFILPQYNAATGGTVTTSGDFKVHTFTGPGTFCVSSVGNAGGSNSVSYMVVAGGGGGGGSQGGGWGGAGAGGAGGFRESKAASDSYTASPLNATSGPTYNLPVSVQGYPITVGGGGSGGPGPNGPSNGSGAKGSNSVFSTITSAGGGGGRGSTPAKGPQDQIDGGSGGGGNNQAAPHPGAAGAGNTPPVSPAQGNNGAANHVQDPSYSMGGGGGATTAGVLAPGASNGSNGGAGATTEISGSPTAYAGGGGSGASQGNTAGTGGTGGGANGASGPANGPSASVNTGGGGGGGAGANTSPLNGGGGGSGIVVIRYKFQ